MHVLCCVGYLAGVWCRGDRLGGWRIIVQARLQVSVTLLPDWIYCQSGGVVFAHAASGLPSGKKVG